MNKWFTVIEEERAMYTHSEIQTFRSESEVPTQIAGTSGPSVKHCSRRSQRWSTQLELELLVECQNFWQSGLPTHVGTPELELSQGLSPKALGLPTGAETSGTQNSRLPLGLSMGEERRWADG